MNYRHAYHAGNFSDVIKHVVLARIVEYLKRKEKSFRVIDTHAGIGLYDLHSDEADKTGEWLEGIGRLTGAQLGTEAATLLAPYFEAVASVNMGPEMTHYPGSPMIVRHLLRKQDRLSAIELHPQDAVLLKQCFEGDFQTRVIELDGWLALGAHLPPKEKRGLVLVDPPFEEGGEFLRLTEGLKRANRRWPGGVYALWYPIKDHKAVAAFRNALTASGIARILDITFMIRPSGAVPRLDGTGMIVVNPPFTLEQELNVILPELHGLLTTVPGAKWGLNWLTGEDSGA